MRKYVISTMLLFVGAVSFLSARGGGGGARGYPGEGAEYSRPYDNPIQRTPSLSRAYPYDGGWYGGGATTVVEPEYPPPPTDDRQPMYPYGS